MSVSNRNVTTTRNITSRVKKFVYALECGDLTTFDVRVMEKYKAYAEFLPRVIINDFMRDNCITDAEYIQFYYLCTVVNVDAQKKNLKKDVIHSAAKKRIKGGAFSSVKLYGPVFLEATYQEIKKANLVVDQDQETKEAC